MHGYTWEETHMEPDGMDLSNLYTHLRQKQREKWREIHSSAKHCEFQHEVGKLANQSRSPLFFFPAP